MKSLFTCTCVFWGETRWNMPMWDSTNSSWQARNTRNNIKENQQKKEIFSIGLEKFHFSNRCCFHSTYCCGLHLFPNKRSHPRRFHNTKSFIWVFRYDYRIQILQRLARSFLSEFYTLHVWQVWQLPALRPGIKQIRLYSIELDR